MTGREKDDAWFAPKRFGYGAGLPIKWQGWAMLLGHVAAIIMFVIWAGSRHLPDGSWPQQAAFLAGVLILALLPMPIYAARTRRGWHWRWGRRGKNDR